MVKYLAEIIITGRKKDENTGEYMGHTVEIITLTPEGLLLALESIGELHFIRYREIPEA
jgi:hypothetical protein